MLYICPHGLELLTTSWFGQVAVACIKVASQAVATMPMLLFWPLIPFLALCCLIVYWVAVAAFLYSAGDIKPMQLTASSSGPYSLAVSSATFCHISIAGRACVHGDASSTGQSTS